jgi:hypothetical protein
MPFPINATTDQAVAWVNGGELPAGHGRCQPEGGGGQNIGRGIWADPFFDVRPEGVRRPGLHGLMLSGGDRLEIQVPPQSGDGGMAAPLEQLFFSGTGVGHGA